MAGKACGSVSIFDRFGKELEMVRRGRASEAFGLRSFVILCYIEKEAEMQKIDKKHLERGISLFVQEIKKIEKRMAKRRKKHAAKLKEADAFIASPLRKTNGSL